MEEVNLDFLNNAAVVQLPILFSRQGTPAPANNLRKMAMTQAEVVPLQAAPTLVQLATVEGALSPKLAAQKLVQLYRSRSGSVAARCIRTGCSSACCTGNSDGCNGTEVD